MTNHIWIGIGLLGQAIFASRFIVQWVASERSRRSVIPMAFWWLSIFGGLILLSYAIWRQDIVFILGQAFGAMIYSRNIILIKRGKQAEKGGDL